MALQNIIFSLYLQLKLWKYNSSMTDFFTVWCPPIENQRLNDVKKFHLHFGCKNITGNLESGRSYLDNVSE